ncbi:putative disease resistance RPP13-like protein 1 [Arachis stenosperma]|uniref:putative disease resistance RPP13-like protein 1 n=1 Tax=Arachis stenosperma TaxID=217475 RepID=UPI0025AB8F30|nr:putative disease resistance RPP13-like protein 1 [Arachis stenosperma]
MGIDLFEGAFLSSFLNVLFDRLSNPVVRKKVDQKLFQRLENILIVVEAVLNDAEKKQITDHAVKWWLENLQDSVYDADDLLDEIATKAAIQEDPGNFLSRIFNSKDRDMVVTRIEEVVATLEDIAKHKDILGLENIAAKNMSRRIPSTSLVSKSVIYGRDKDKEAIVNLLLDDTRDGKISTIVIVGMGGIGKTTLAKLVYNDDRVGEKFDFKAWVSVGEIFDIVEVTKRILEEAWMSPSNTHDLKLLQHHLKERLKGKKFLVVLDDIFRLHWDAWEVFQSPFQYGSGGSKILVTSCDNEVASLTSAVPAYKLSLLSDENCWLVFAKHAGLSTKSPNYLALEKVGRKIVTKCTGLPLAAETLGGLLRTNQNVEDWNSVLKSKIWGFATGKADIFHALLVRYHQLPSYLKRCVVYCSLYPDGYIFKRDQLISLWMAEDLLPPPKRGSTLEETGYECFNVLT